MFGTDIMIELRMFGFTNIAELVSPPPPSILKTPEGCKDKRQKPCFCISVFLFLSISKKCVQFNILDSILIFFAKHLGELSSWIVVFGPCRALRGESTISKMCVQFNILDFILIFVPNIWGSYQVGLLSLGPVGP